MPVQSAKFAQLRESNFDDKRKTQSEAGRNCDAKTNENLFAAVAAESWKPRMQRSGMWGWVVEGILAAEQREGI